MPQISQAYSIIVQSYKNFAWSWKSEPATYGSGRASQEGLIPQILQPYSAIVWSELNFPVSATFKMAIFAHNAWSWKKYNHFGF